MSSSSRGIRGNPFPKLTNDNSFQTSPATPTYNCIAWAAGDDSRWWCPNSVGAAFFWPINAPRDMRIESLIAMFVTQGYSPCDDGSVETGYEKIAIFGAEQDWTHAARQLPNGHWTSKLGKSEDITHFSAELLDGPAYGNVRQFMRRPMNPTADEA